METAEKSLTLSELQFASTLGISVQLLRQLRRQGRVPFVRVGKRGVRYLRDDAHRFLEQHRQAETECAA
jgi:excisionase family DNA binding protein